MFSLRLLARVPAEKRQEFLESLTSLTAKEGGPCRKLFLKDLTDETLYCWMGDCNSAEELDAFMRSDTFRAIRGAAQVLGSLEDVSIVEIRQGFFGGRDNHVTLRECASGNYRQVRKVDVASLDFGSIKEVQTFALDEQKEQAIKDRTPRQ